MKRKILTLGVLLCTVSVMEASSLKVLNLTNINSETLSKLEKDIKKRIEIDQRIVAEDGSIWHVSGWMVVELSFGGVAIVDYDLVLTSPNGDEFRFKYSAKVNTTSGEIEEIIEGRSPGAELIGLIKAINLSEDVQSVFNQH